MSRRRGAALSIAVCLSLAACSGDGGGATGPVALDGSPRRPDTAGVIESATRNEIVVDGQRYKLARAVQAFSTITLQPVPLVGRVGQYAQLGTSGGTVHWVGVFGAAANVPGRGRVTFYTGEVKDVDGDDLVFKEGTVLRAGRNVDVPDTVVGKRVNAEIDVKTDRVQSVVVAAI